MELPTDKILAEVADGVGWLTINNPERRNAISLDMWDAMREAVGAFGADAAVRCVVLRGAGDKAFASGADISQFEKERADADAVPGLFIVDADSLNTGFHTQHGQFRAELVGLVVAAKRARLQQVGAGLFHPFHALACRSAPDLLLGDHHLHFRQQIVELKAWFGGWWHRLLLRLA